MGKFTINPWWIFPVRNVTNYQSYYLSFINHSYHIFQFVLLVITRGYLHGKSPYLFLVTSTPYRGAVAQSIWHGLGVVIAWSRMTRSRAERLWNWGDTIWGTITIGGELATNRKWVISPQWCTWDKGRANPLMTGICRMRILVVIIWKYLVIYCYRIISNSDTIFG
jgi:hypothetical protein